MGLADPAGRGLSSITRPVRAADAAARPRRAEAPAPVPAALAVIPADPARAAGVSVPAAVHPAAAAQGAASQAAAAVPVPAVPAPAAADSVPAAVPPAEAALDAGAKSAVPSPNRIKIHLYIEFLSRIKAAKKAYENNDAWSKTGIVIFYYRNRGFFLRHVPKNFSLIE